jgi:hypothetical protein
MNGTTAQPAPSPAADSKALRSLESKIRAVRRGIARWFVVDGLVRLIGAFLLACVVDFFLDYFFQMDRAQRAIMLALIVGGTCWVAWRWLLRPLKASVSDEAICHEVGARNPSDGGRILTALEFARTDWSDRNDVSHSLVAFAVADGEGLVEKVSFGGVLRRGKFSVNVLILTVLGCLLAAGVAGVFKNNLMGIWANRNLMLGNMSWPADFHLAVDGADGNRIVVPRGDTWPITARVSDGYKALPDEVQIEFRTRSGRQLESMNMSDGHRTFVYRVASVVEPFRFRLRSGRVTTEWFDADLIERPLIEQLTLRATPPAYTGKSAEALPQGSDTYYVLAGTALEISGQVSKPLASASLALIDREVPLSVDGERFSAQIAPDKVTAGAWQLHLVDTEQVFQPGAGIKGLGTRDPVVFNVRQFPDKAPGVKASLKGIGSLVLPIARLPYEATIEDDYKVTKIELEYAWRQDQSEAEGENVSVVVPESAAAVLGSANADFTDAFDLQPLEIPPASRLRIKLRAEDNDTVSGPNVGESTDILLRVVTETELRNQFLLRERQQRQIFEDIAKRQDTLMTDCEAFLADTRSLEEVSGDQRSELFKLQRRQKLIGGNIKPVIESLRGVLAEAVNNRLPDDEDVLKNRLQERIIVPMQHLREQLVPSAAVPLDSARTVLDSRIERNAALENALAGQRAAIVAMNEILAHMIKNEKFQLAIIRLYEIQRLQNEVKAGTDAEKELALKKLLEEQKDEEE